MAVKGKVLIVEDDRAISNFIRRVLEANGYEALMVHTGREANSIMGNLGEKYMVGIEAKGKAGQRIDMYCNSASGFTQFTNYSNALQDVVTGAEDGTADGSISSMACGKNTIVVGSYNTKDHYVIPNVNNETAILGYEQLKVGDMSYFTSYGTLTDGTTRPHIPGLLITLTNALSFFPAHLITS